MQRHAALALEAMAMAAAVLVTLAAVVVAELVEMLALCFLHTACTTI